MSTLTVTHALQQGHTYSIKAMPPIGATTTFGPSIHTPESLGDIPIQTTKVRMEKSWY